MRARCSDRGGAWAARRVLTVAAAVCLLAAGCGAPGASPRESAERSTASAAPPSAPTPGTIPEDPPGQTRSTPAPSGDRAPHHLDHLDRARRIVARMSLEEKAGQVIVAGFGGTKTPRSLVRDLRVGGVIVMGYNVASAGQVRRINDALQREQRRIGRSWPLLLGVDQEGGTITRIGAPTTTFPTYQTLGAARDPRLASEVARASGRELRALGFTAVFAPVADVTSGPDDPTIGTRSAGSDPDRVAEVVRASLQGYAEAGIVAVPKHFPGHGSVPADSHVRLPVQKASRAQLERRDLVPFVSALGAPAMMVAHLDLRAIDPGVPSSLSSEVVDGLLRDELGYDGVIVTDGMHMGAISERYDEGEAAVRALRAGVDVLLLPADAVATRDGIVDGVTRGRLPESRLDQAASRVIAMQLAHQASAKDRPAHSILGDADRLSYRASLAGLTVVSGPCGGRLVGDRVEVVGGTAADRAAFARAARAAGLRVGWNGTRVRLLGSGDASGDGDVVVALDAPYGLAASRATKARIAMFGRTPQAFEALVDVLRGAARAEGRLPVPVRGAPSGAGCPR